VDKVACKGLSTEDYVKVDKKKLEEIKGINTRDETDVTIYRDGIPIPLLADATVSGALKTVTWCYYAGTDGATYGKMYNWYVVAGVYDTASLNDPSLRTELALVGWHVPSDYEWTTFMSSLGGEIVAGGKINETGSTHWKSPNTDATNSGGFTALPEDYRSHIGAFRFVGEIGQCWSSSEPSLDYADCCFRSITIMAKPTQSLSVRLTVSQCAALRINIL
jgi:uncharacterized protein (TIGR02145 family)